MVRTDVGLTLETSASLSSFDGNLAVATFMCSLSQSFFRKLPFNHHSNFGKRRVVTVFAVRFMYSTVFE